MSADTITRADADWARNIRNARAMMANWAWEDLGRELEVQSARRARLAARKQEGRVAA